jgi:DNA-binding transcriptional regulator YiaG
MHSGVMVTGEEIKKAREILGESQAAFGVRLAVDQSTVHRWETGKPPRRGPARLAVENLLKEVASRQQSETTQ